MMIEFESGYFDSKNKKYIISNMTPKRPLANYIWSEEFMLRCNHFGLGDSFAKVAYNTRRPVIGGEGSRLIYIKDRTTKEHFCANGLYTKKQLSFQQAEIKAGSHTVIGEELGIRVTLTLTVPLRGYAELWRVEVENRSDRDRDLSIYAHTFLCSEYAGHCSYTYTKFNKTANGIVSSHEPYPEPGKLFYEHSHIYFASSAPVNSYSTSEDTFRGLYRTFAEPIGLETDSLDNKDSSYNNYNAAALELRLSLAKGEKKTVYFVGGAATSAEESEADAQKFLASGFFEEVLAERERRSLETEKIYTLKSNNQYLDDMINTFLKTQIDLGKTWARVYGCGFRDVMQDIAAFVSLDTDVAKKKILLALSHQFPNGNPIRMFEPFFRADYRDGAVWIPETVSAYLNETGDAEFLNEECPYFECDESGTVLDHLRRGMTFLTTTVGSHGLCLWGHGDWNDSTNAAGIRGKGESVWLSIATVKALKTFAVILTDTGRTEEAEKWLLEAEKLTCAVKKYGWDKDHYIHGYNDDGKKVGSYESEGARFYLNMQTWAVLAGIEEGKDGHRLMDRVEEELHCPYGYVQCAPSYTKGDPTIGRTTYFKPGCIENGSVYNHGVTFKIAADCMLGRSEDAYRTVREIMADNPELYGQGVEPYAVASMYMGPENMECAKSSPTSWITGTAGWLYRCVTEYMLGVKANFNGLRIAPALPSEFDGAEVSRIYRGATYNITLHKGSYRLLCDGKEIDGDTLPIFPEGSAHTVEVWA